MSKFVMVDTVSQFRMRYVVEVPDDHNDGEFPCSAKEWAMDTVTMNEAREFSQEHLGETIVSSRELTRNEILALCDEDNTYVKSWSDDRKIAAFVTEIGYKPE